MSPESRRTQVVEVHMVGRIARIAPGDAADSLVSFAREQLRYTRMCFAAGGPLGHESRHVTKQLWQRDEDGSILVPAAFVPTMVEQLTSAGFKVNIRDHRRLDPKAVPAGTVLQAAAADDRAFLCAAAREPFGLIEVRRNRDIVRLAAALCHLFPSARVMLTCNGARRLLRTLCLSLEQAGAGRVDLVRSYGWPWEGGRLLCSMVDFDRASHNPDGDFDVVIFLDALQALADGHQEALGRFRGCQRMYGLVRANATLSHRARLRLQASIGPVIYRVPDPRGEHAHVNVLWFRPPWSPPSASPGSLARKQGCYWHNDARNDALASVATAFAAGNIESLWHHGLLLGDCASDLVAAGAPCVTVVVESTLHARELLQRLPGWRLVSAAPEQKAPPCTNPFMSWSTRAIVTCLAAHKLEALDTDVMILAGPEAPLALPGFPPLSRGPEHRIMIVDVADDFDAMAESATRRRLRHYAAQGWSLIGPPSWGMPKQLRREQVASREVINSANLAASSVPPSES
jgi:hypothetical protein